MGQLGLKIPARISYKADNFIRHSGVRTIINQVLSLANSEAFNLCWIEGERRSGKTHLSITLTDLLINYKFQPRCIEGAEFKDFLESGQVEQISARTMPFIIDSAEEYFNSLTTGNSGAFVNFIEKLRVAGSLVIFLSRTSVQSLACDEHIMSRLRPGQGLKINMPADEELPEVIAAMAKQRGMVLSERKIEFIRRRIGRSIEAIERYLDRVYHLSSVLGRGVRFPILGDAL
ncbi:MAG: hypothetical protein D6719_02135 [Candidatus Dadabacteria bacterium]|nr:MAG: hypothetical protein D6719_02135 [Candidatus Dadabacteria bacterium]